MLASGDTAGKFLRAVAKARFFEIADCEGCVSSTVKDQKRLGNKKWTFNIWTQRLDSSGQYSIPCLLLAANDCQYSHMITGSRFRKTFQAFIFALFSFVLPDSSPCEVLPGAVQPACEGSRLFALL